MRRVFLAILISVLSPILLAQFTWAAGSTPHNTVVFYQDGCGGGRYLELGVGSYSDLRDYRTGGSGGQTWNDQISCIFAGSGVTKVIVYEHINFEGKSKEFTRSWGNPDGRWSVSDDWWDNRISSIKIIGPGSSSPWDEPVPRDRAVFYQDECGSSTRVDLKPGEYSDLRELRVGSGSSTWDDRISCIKLGSNITKVIVYEHTDFKGRSEEFTRSGMPREGWSITGEWCNDKITSLKVFGPGYKPSSWDEPAPRDRAVFYQDECGSSTRVDLKPGAYPDLRELRVGSGSSTWDDRISCIKLGSNITKVIVYEHTDFQGRSKEFTRSGMPHEGWSITGEWCNDKITSLKVIGPGYKPSSWDDPAPRDRAVFYQDECGSSTRVDLKKGDYPDLRELSVGSGSSTWDDRISCIKLGSGINRVIVYEHTDFQGRSKEFTRSGMPDEGWSITGEWCNDKITSIKVR